MHNSFEQEKYVSTDTDTGKSFEVLGEGISHSAEVEYGPEDGSVPGPLTGMPTQTGYEPKRGESVEGHERFQKVDADVLKQFSNMVFAFADLEENKSKR